MSLSSVLLGLVCLFSVLFLWFRQRAVPRATPSPAVTSTPSPAVPTRANPSPAVLSWSTPSPTVPTRPTVRSPLLSNFGTYGDFQRTTYQAGERLFGEFQCPQCHRKWASGNSWVNTRQECLNCRIMVSPHYQRRLDMPAQETYTRDLDKPHLTEMCEKCQQLGRDCSRRW